MSIETFPILHRQVLIRNMLHRIRSILVEYGYNFKFWQSFEILVEIKSKSKRKINVSVSPTSCGLNISPCYCRLYSSFHCRHIHWCHDRWCSSISCCSSSWIMFGIPTATLLKFCLKKIGPFIELFPYISYYFHIPKIFDYFFFLLWKK